MQETLFAPQISDYLERLGSMDYRAHQEAVSYDNQAYKDIDEIYKQLHLIVPNGLRSSWRLWLRAERGPITAFGDINEYLEQGIIDNEDDFHRLWLDYYPFSEEWYELVAVDDPDINYRAISLARKFVIEVDGRKDCGPFEYNIAKFTSWILSEIKRCVEELKTGFYNDNLRSNLPVRYRTGTIQRKHYWNVFPEYREKFFMNIKPDAVEEFIGLVRNQGESVGRLKAMTANDFYQFCALGYAENDYPGTALSPKAQYYKHSDGRDGGLREIDPNSPEAFAEWMEYHSLLGHPWEVCRGGNSTHIDLYVNKDAQGYYLTVAGSARNRTIEAVKFYLALSRAGVPVEIHDGELLAQRLEGTEKIGIVPQHIFPAYCGDMFPDDNVKDFVNLPLDNTQELLPFCEWLPIPDTSLV